MNRVEISRAGARIINAYPPPMRPAIAGILTYAQTEADIPEPLRSLVVRAHDDPDFIPAPQETA